MEGQQPKVAVGCPVRDRAWILPRYLEHIYRLDYPKKQMWPCFVVNDSDDETLDILLAFKSEHEREYAGFTLTVWNLGQPKDARIHSVRKHIYRTLALLRNLLLRMAVDAGADYLFSVDSDVLVPPHALRDLVVCGKDIVAAQIWNDRSRTCPNIMVHKPGRLVHYADFPRNSLFRCDVTGAVCLMSRKVCETVRYRYHDKGEDVGFCDNAVARGFEIWVDSRVTCEHIMNRSDLGGTLPQGEL